MLGKLYKYLAILGAFALTILYALLQREKKERIEDELENVEAESEALSRNSEALAESERLEQESIERVKAGPVDRGHFSRKRVL